MIIISYATNVSMNYVENWNMSNVWVPAISLEKQQQQQKDKLTMMKQECKE